MSRPTVPTEPTGRPVALIGTGVIGSATIGRLLAAGRQVVVPNRTREHAAAVLAAGARWASGADEVVDRCDVVFSGLRNTSAVRAVHGDLVRRVRPGQILAEHGTFDPGRAAARAGAAAERGGAFLDAPVTGGRR